MNTKILVIGSLNMDLVVIASRHPRIGETILGTSFNTFPGGKGANQAIAAARLGASVQMIGCVGEDAFGQALLDNLSKNRVDCTHLKTSNTSSSGTALITVDQTGRNSIIVVPGSNHDLLPSDLDSLENEISSAGMVILQMEIQLETVWKSIRMAKKHAVPVLLNPAPANSIPDEYLNGLDYLVPNESELNSLTGLPTNTLPEISKAINILISKGVKRVILTRGELGCYYMDRETAVQIPSLKVNPVDTTGAGDAFIGGFAYSLVLGETIQEALKTGVTAGAMAVTKAGAQTSFPTRQEFEDFL
jgi:ribokinase